MVTIPGLPRYCVHLKGQENNVQWAPTGASLLIQRGRKDCARFPLLEALCCCVQVCSSGPICPTGLPKTISGSGHGEWAETAGQRETKIDDVECLWLQKLEAQFSLRSLWCAGKMGPQRMEVNEGGGG